MTLLIIELIALAPLFLVVGYVYLKRRQLDKNDRRDPITTDLLCLPADSLQERIESLAEKRLDRVVFTITTGLICALILSSRRVVGEIRPWDFFDGVIIVGALGFALFHARKIAKDMPVHRNLKQAARAEQATAQELAASLAGDNRILNDVKAKDFNIDHVVITPAGVFAVETKSRLKPPAGQGAAAVKVRYDGKALEFPTWTENKPIQQAERQARWLADHLKRSTGEAFPVFAVVALPGWFIENTTRITDDMVRVVNPKNVQWLLLPDKSRSRLNSKDIQQAAYAIEKLAMAGV